MEQDFGKAKEAYERLIMLALFGEYRLQANSKAVAKDLANTFGILDNYFGAKKLCGKESVIYWHMSEV